MLIAIDGGASTGKSTVCTALAQYFGVPYFNAGLVYRALATWAIRQNVDVTHIGAAETRAAVAILSVEFRSLSTRVLLDGEDITDILKEEVVTLAVPHVAALPYVREALTTLQRRVADVCISEYGGVIVDGRDATSVVWPSADVRVLLVPQEEFVRAGEDTVGRDALDSRHSDFVNGTPGVVIIGTRQTNLDVAVNQIIDLASHLGPH